MKVPRIDPLASEILTELRGLPEADRIILGGYFVLRHYLDYRTTHDIDAWWATGRSESAMAGIRRAMETVAGRHGMQLREREWGETASFELVEAGRRIFSFQIAVRSIELEEPQMSAWSPILLESLADNVGAKMNALVQRGSARDFLDVKELVQRGIATVEQCWQWWSSKNPDLDQRLAKANVLKHLEALDLRRPLDRIEDPDEREGARRARAWIRETLLKIVRGPE